MNGQPLSRTAQWLGLVVLSVMLTGVFEALHLPAALLIGPMTAAVISGVRGASIRVPAKPFIGAQGIIGCLIGASVPISVLAEAARDWPIFLGAIVAVIGASTGLGLLLARLSVLPGTTAIWGTSAGASTSMIIMSEAYGGDPRLVAVMQNLRIMAVAFAATLVAKFAGVGSDVPGPAAQWLPPIEPKGLALTLATGFAGAWLAVALRLPAGTLLIPVAGVLALKEFFGLSVSLPPWLLAACYALVGWSVGLRFTWATITDAARALPAVLASIAALMAVCGLVAVALVMVAGVSPLTAYLATCPGGLDTVAIIAASSNANVGFIMAMQTMRLLIVMAVSPLIARFLAERTMDRRPEAGP